MGQFPKGRFAAAARIKMRQARSAAGGKEQTDSQRSAEAEAKEQEGAWNAIKDSKDPELFASFRKAYPAGRFAEPARLKEEALRRERAQAALQLPSAVAASPARSVVLLNTTPAGAQVYLNNGYSGKTPVNLEGLDPGKYTVELRLTGYRTWKEDVQVREGQRLALNETLEEFKGAALDARMVSASVDIFLNGSPRGKGGQVIDGLEPGIYEIEARQPRSRPWKDRITLTAGMTQAVEPKFKGYTLAIFPGNLTGQYVDYVDRSYGARTTGEWALLGLSQAVNSYSFDVTYSRYKEFPVAPSVIDDIDKETWQGFFSKSVNTDFVREKAQAMDLDAVLLLQFSNPGPSGPIDVYLYDSKFQKLYHAHKSWRIGNITESVANATREVLDQFMSVRSVRLGPPALTD